MESAPARFGAGWGKTPFNFHNRRCPMGNSNSKTVERKSVDRPPKPRPDFPLCAASNGYWKKKIAGKIHYFGKWGQVVNV